MKNIGAHYSGNYCCTFSVFAPEKESMTLQLVFPQDKKIPMQKTADGYFVAELNYITPGTQYYFVPDNTQPYPDPASNYQRHDVHKASEVIDHNAFIWNDSAWKGIPFNELVMYELHVGTFTQKGTFEAIIPLLDDLVAIGINAIELMPVAQFPGNRNWGYDGVYPYAVQHSYGGPEGLKTFVDACHQKGIAVFLDVVYNHFGPEGNYVAQFAPFFTERYKVPWGDAINFDGEWSDGIKAYFINNIVHWFEKYHIDGLRLDAVHEIYDRNAVNFWQLAKETVQQLQQQLGRPLYLVAECDYNSSRVIKPVECGGMELTAQWLDDFHHALYVILDRKGQDRYIDFGLMEQLAKAYKEGFVHAGEFVKARKRNHGESSAGVRGDKFIAFNLNHDQVGNRPKGERLAVLVDFERLKLAAAALLLSPYIPMLFMGEEYGEEAPFYFFISHHDTELIKLVQEGRNKEFAQFGDFETPDPYSEKTFDDCKINWHLRKSGKHKILLEWHTKLIALRKEHAALKEFDKNFITVHSIRQQGIMLIRQTKNSGKLLVCIFNFSDETMQYTMPMYANTYTKILDSKERPWLWNDDDEYSSTHHTNTINKADEISIAPLSVVIYANAE